MKFHHVAIATHSIDETAQWYVAQGYSLTGDIQEDIIQKVRYAFLKREEKSIKNIIILAMEICA